MKNIDTGSKWSQDELSKAFDKAVRSTEELLGEEPGSRHWKDKIVAVIDLDQVDVTAYAIAFYTATEARVLEVHNQPEKRCLIAAGYRAGPAGDH